MTKKKVDRAKQRANTRGSAVTEPLEIDDDDDENENDSDNNNREDDLFSDDSNADPDKGGYRDPDDNDPGDDRDPDDNYTQSTDDEQTKKKNSSKRKTPQVPSGFPVMLTGHARKHLKRERLPMFWSQLAQNPQLPSSWRKMVWIVSMRSKN